LADDDLRDPLQVTAQIHSSNCGSTDMNRRTAAAHCSGLTFEMRSLPELVVSGIAKAHGKKVWEFDIVFRRSDE
jgi:hypothetical protein